MLQKGRVFSMAEIIAQEKIPVKAFGNGDQIPAMGMGTFGSDKYTSGQVAEAVYGGIRSGYRLIDCASVYQNEAEIGQVLKRVMGEGVVRREELFVISKVWNDMHAPGKVREACEQSLKDLNTSYLDLYLIHWPFPNYHAPGCAGDARNPDSRPFSAEEYREVWRQCEELVRAGWVKYIGMSNMTIPKLEAVLPLCEIRPTALEMELHPGFQQPELFEYAMTHQMQPIGYCPLGSPSRPERDRTSTDVSDTAMPEIVEIAKKHQISPVQVCLKWAVQRGQIPIPFSVKEPQYVSNLRCITEDPLSAEEMEQIRKADRNCRLIKGQVFLWPGAERWEELWDMDGFIQGTSAD